MMFKILKKLTNKIFNPCKFKWYDIGEKNPFNKRVLDITGYVCCAGVSNNEFTNKFSSLRNSDGLYLKNIDTTKFSSAECSLTYPHNGKSLQGIVHKAEGMYDKWDIYIYDEMFYFANSWSGKLLFKAYANISDEEIKIVKIEYVNEGYVKDDPELAKNYVHFLMLSHFMGQVVPHPIPDWIDDEEMMFIARISYNQFGGIAFYATKQGILDLEINDTDKSEL